jgi:hypothetical protein
VAVMPGQAREAGEPVLTLRDRMPGQAREAGEPVLTFRDMMPGQAGEPVLTLRDMMPGQAAMRVVPARPGARAVAGPDSARAQQAPQLTAARQVRPVTRAQREVLRLAGDEDARIGRRLRRLLIGRRPYGGGEPVVWIRPLGGLARIRPGPGDSFRQQGQQVAAALPHGRERDGVPGQAQRDLERASRPVPARYRGDRQHGAIDAA